MAMNFDYIYQNGSFEEQINGNFDKIDKLETLSVTSKIDDHEDAETGKLYLIDENEDELLSGKEGQIVWYDNNLGWQFYQPTTGKIAYLQDEGKFYYFDGTTWQEFSTGTASQVISGGSGESIDLSGYMQKASNLNDLSNKATARSNLNVYSKSETYTKSEVDTMIANIPTGNSGSPNVDLSNYYTKADVYNKSEVDEIIDDIEGDIANIQPPDLSNYYNKTETYSKTEVNTLIANIPSGGGGTIVSASSNVVGDYKMSAQTTDHDNWFICNGREISRTEYAELFALVGTAFGEGDGETTFNLPDFRDKTMWGANGNLNSTLAAGLPNITASWGTTYIRRNGNTQPSGAATGSLSSATAFGGTNSTSVNNFGFDASKENPIYGNSTTVQPPAVCVNVFILVG
ncbi:MAG: tail fiber protein [Rickettsiales bacterium]|nr:tail fiber protein [Rickettsiales bacterium]